MGKPQGKYLKKHFFFNKKENLKRSVRLIRYLQEKNAQ